MRKLFVLAALALLAGVLAVGKAPMAQADPAALISLDDPFFGSDSLTFDPASNLEWLDLPLSSGGLTYASVISGEGGFLDEGFRIATTCEVLTLLNAVGAVPTFGVSVPFTTANFAPVTELQSFVGITTTFIGREGSLGLAELDVFNPVLLTEIFVQTSGVIDPPNTARAGVNEGGG